MNHLKIAIYNDRNLLQYSIDQYEWELLCRVCILLCMHYFWCTVGICQLKCECCCDNTAVQLKVTNYLVLHIYLKNIKMSIGNCKVCMCVNLSCILINLILCCWLIVYKLREVLPMVMWSEHCMYSVVENCEYCLLLLCR